MTTRFARLLMATATALSAVAQSQPQSTSPAEGVTHTPPQFSVNGEPRKELYLITPTTDGTGGKLVKVTGIRYGVGSIVELSVEQVEQQDRSPVDLTAISERATVAVASSAPASPFTRVLVNYSGTKEVSCPQSYPAVVFASCDYTGLPILWDQNSLLPTYATASTHWTYWLIPNAQSPTGVHCAQPSYAFSSQARLLCTSLH